jgi:hypothetical protein
MSVKLQLRRGLASEWISTIVLSAGEPGFETDTGKFKIGDGITQWGTLPYATTSDTPVLTIKELTDVAVGTPTTGEVLKWNGTDWANSPEAGAVNINDLSDVVITSPASGQFLKYSAGAWRNATNTDLNTTYTFSAAVPTAPDTGANLVLTSSASTTNTVRLIPGTNMSIAQTSSGTVNISGQNVTATAETFTGVGVDGATVKILNGGGAFSGINIVGSVTEVERLNATNIRINSPNFTLGVEPLAAVGGAAAAKLKITNSLSSAIVGAVNIFAGTGITLSLGTGATANNLTITNSNGRVEATTSAGRIAFYDAVGNVVTPTGAGLSWDKTTATLAVTGRVDATTLYGTNTQFTDTIVANEVASSGSLVKGLVFANHYASTAVNGFIFQRSTGTRAAPTAITANMQLGKVSFVGRGVDDTYTLSAMISATAYGTLSSGSIPTALAFLATAQGGTLAPVAVIQDGKFLVNEITHRTGTTLTLSSSVLVDTITAKTTGGNLTLAGNGAGTVALPAGTTVGGALIGSLLLKGTVADNTALLALTGMVTGDAYIVLSPTPTHIWTYNGASWVDLGAFQGAAGSNGQGVPTGGTTGQYLKKTSSTDYATAFATIAYSEISGTPTLATVATTGLYSSLTGAPIIPTDVSDLTDTGSLLFSGLYADLTGAPTVPVDISDLTDTGSLLFSGLYEDLTGAPADLGDLTDTGGLIPTDLGDLTDTGGLIPATLTDLGITDGTPGQVLTTNGSGAFTFTTVSGGGGGTGLGSRTTASAATGSLANGATGTVSITGFKSYALLKVQTTHAAWVRIYTDATSRSNDASRSEGTDPAAGAGVIAEVITTGAQTVVITPGTIGFNNDGSPTTTIYAAVTNKSGGTATITTTLTVLQLEA